MKIVLDTTVFENSINSRSAEVQLLKSFLDGGGSELCVPAVVYEEARNRVRKRVTDANSKIAAVQRLTGGTEGFRVIKPDEVLRVYEEALKTLFKDLAARLLPVPTVSHTDLLKRALVPKKPFVDSGRGIETRSSGTASLNC